MAHTFIRLTHDNTLNQRGRRGKDLLRVAISKATACLSGVERGTNFTLVSSGTDPAFANSAILIGADPTGAVGGIINGVTLTATWITSATVAAGLVAAAINASTNAIVQHLVAATTLKSTVTLATVVAGTTVNFAGFRFTAIAGTAGSVPAKDGDFVITGTDTQAGTSLAGAINRHPYACRFLFAYNVAGAVNVHPRATTAWFTGPQAPPNRVQASAATVTVGSATFVASANCGVYARVPGKFGNCITIALSGGNVTIENTNTRLTRGLGGDANPVTDTL